MAQKILERVEAHYESREVPFGKVYEWHPAYVVIECECGEKVTLTATSTMTTCSRCGADLDVEGFVHDIQERDSRMPANLTHPWFYDASDRVWRVRQLTRSSPNAPYWLIARHRPGGSEILIIDGAQGGPALPAFSFEDGARECLHSYAREGGWEATPIGNGELLLLLDGPCAKVECVALDALPEIVAEGATGLVSLPRQSFVDSLLGRGRTWFEDHYRREGQAHG